MLNKIIKAYIKSSVPNRETSSLLLKLLEDYTEGKLGGASSADQVSYDNSTSGSSATNVQEAIDQLFEGITPEAKYELSFNTSSWLINGEFYEIVVTQTVHKKGTNPVVNVFETIESEDHSLLVNIIVDDNGNIKIQTTASPDNRFSGKLIVQ